MSQQEKKFAALAPLMALCGVFVHPTASTVLPLILYFIFSWRKMEFSRLVALRTADLAFSVQLFLVLGSVLLTIYVSYNPMPQNELQGIIRNFTLATVGYLIISLIIGIIQTFRNKAFSYPLSLKIAERLFNATRKK